MTASVPLLFYFIFVFLLFLAFLPDKQPCQSQQAQQYGGDGGGSAAGQTRIGIGIKGSLFLGIFFIALSLPEKNTEGGWFQPYMEALCAAKKVKR